MSFHIRFRTFKHFWFYFILLHISSLSDIRVLSNLSVSIRLSSSFFLFVFFSQCYFILPGLPSQIFFFSFYWYCYFFFQLLGLQSEISIPFNWKISSSDFLLFDFSLIIPLSLDNLVHLQDIVLIELVFHSNADIGIQDTNEMIFIFCIICFDFCL